MTANEIAKELKDQFRAIYVLLVNGRLEHDDQLLKHIDKTEELLVRIRRLVDLRNTQSDNLKALAQWENAADVMLKTTTDAVSELRMMYD